MPDSYYMYYAGENEEQYDVVTLPSVKNHRTCLDAGIILRPHSKYFSLFCHF